MQKRHYYILSKPQALVIKLIVAFILLTISRLILFFVNPGLFQTSGQWTGLLWHGLRFDGVTLAYFASLFTILTILPFNFSYTKGYQKIADILLIVPLAMALAINIMDAIYYRFTLKRTTADIFNYLTHSVGDEITGLIPQFFIDFWYMFIIWVLLVVIIITVCNRIMVKKPAPSSAPIKTILLRTAFSLSVIIATIIGMRGGIQLKPISIVTAGRFVEPANTPLILNTPFTIMKTLGKRPLQQPHYMPQEVAQSLFNPLHHYQSSQSKPKKNVVIIILESFTSEHSSWLNKNSPNHHGYTPFLDSIMQQSMTFNGYANGKRSIEGIPAVISSLPNLMDDDFISSPYSTNRIEGLPAILKKAGYASAFFHGGNNGTMGFDAYCQTAGFQKYYGRNEYPELNDFDGKWGIFDEPYMQYMAHEITQNIKQPFIASLFTLSSHHPYTVPQKYQNSLPTGSLPIQQSIAYTDMALRKFFKTAQKQPWFNNTLFVFTADHTSEGYHPFYRTRAGMYSIPIIFYSPQKGILPEGVQNNTAQQTDIMPTVLAFLGYNQPFIAFGQNLLDTTQQHFAINYINGNYQFISQHHALLFDGKKSVALYNLKQDPLQKNNLISTETTITCKMDSLVRAVVQQFNQRMTENQLTSN